MSFDAPLLRIRAAVRILKGEFQMKQYQKPEVLWENFALAEHIAQCDYTLGLNDPTSCVVKKDNYDDDYGNFEGIFLSKEACSRVLDDFTRYCYTNGAAGMPRLFQS